MKNNVVLYSTLMLKNLCNAVMKENKWGGLREKRRAKREEGRDEEAEEKEE